MVQLRHHVATGFRYITSVRQRGASNDERYDIVNRLLIAAETLARVLYARPTHPRARALFYFLSRVRRLRHVPRDEH